MLVARPASKPEACQLFFFNRISDPVGGWIASKACRAPGGNSTGFTNLRRRPWRASGWEITQGSDTKFGTLALLLIAKDPTKPSVGVGQQKSLKSAAASLGGTDCACRGARNTRYSKQSSTLAYREANRTQALSIMPSVITVAQRRIILDLNLKYNQFPLIYPFSIVCQGGGGLISVTEHRALRVDEGRWLLIILDRNIFTGEARRLSVQAADQIRIGHQLKTAKALGLEFRPRCSPAPTR